MGRRLHRYYQVIMFLRLFRYNYYFYGKPSLCHINIELEILKRFTS
jgi:hypothetical protein